MSGPGDSSGMNGYPKLPTPPPNRSDEPKVKGFSVSDGGYSKPKIAGAAVLVMVIGAAVGFLLAPDKKKQLEAAKQRSMPFDGPVVQSALRNLSEEYSTPLFADFDQSSLDGDPETALRSLLMHQPGPTCRQVGSNPRTRFRAIRTPRIQRERRRPKRSSIAQTKKTAGAAWSSRG